MPKMEKLAVRIMDFLFDNCLWIDCAIYVGNKRYRSTSTPERIPFDEGKRTNNETPYLVDEDIDVLNYVRYANPDTLTLTFEGPLYEKLQEYGMVYKHLEQMFDNASYYMDFGYSWSLSLYPND